MMEAKDQKASQACWPSKTAPSGSMKCDDKPAEIHQHQWLVAFIHAG